MQSSFGSEGPDISTEVQTTIAKMPLKGVPFILSPELLHVLCAAGHGDEIGKVLLFGLVDVASEK